MKQQYMKQEPRVRGVIFASSESVPNRGAAAGDREWPGTGVGVGVSLRWRHSPPPDAGEVWEGHHQDAGQVRVCTGERGGDGCGFFFFFQYKETDKWLSKKDKKDPRHATPTQKTKGDVLSGVSILLCSGVRGGDFFIYLYIFYSAAQGNRPMAKPKREKCS